MFLRATSCFAAPSALCPDGVAVGIAAPAEPAEHCLICNLLYVDAKPGGSESRSTANKQRRAGNGHSAFVAKARAVYRVNHSPLDRENEGAACEA